MNRLVQSVIATVVGLATIAAAHAQTYLAKVVRIVSPFVPGDWVDLMPRTITVRLTETLGQQVIVEKLADRAGLRPTAQGKKGSYTGGCRETCSVSEGRKR